MFMYSPCLTQFFWFICSRQRRMRKGDDAGEALRSTGTRSLIGGWLTSRNSYPNTNKRKSSYFPLLLFCHIVAPWILDDFCGCESHVFTWGRQVAMEENVTTRWAVQFLTQQQASHCTDLHTNTHWQNHFRLFKWSYNWSIFVSFTFEINWPYFLELRSLRFPFHLFSEFAKVWT